MKYINNQRGSSSILVVLVFLMLGIFSVLGMMSSYSDYKLALKNAEWNRDYYSLEGQAHAFTAGMDKLFYENREADIDTLQEIIAEAEPHADMEELDGKLLISNMFTSESGKKLLLQVELSPENQGGCRVITRKEVPEVFEYVEEPEFVDVEVIVP